MATYTDCCEKCYLKLGKMKSMKKWLLLILTCLFYFSAESQVHNGGGTFEGSMVFQIKINGQTVNGTNPNDWTFYLYFTNKMGEMFGSTMMDVSLGNVNSTGEPSSIDNSAFDAQAEDLYLTINFADWGGSSAPDPASYKFSITIKNTSLKIDKTQDYDYDTYVIDGTFFDVVDIECSDCETPTPTGPTLAVSPLIAGCWFEGGTFDLTSAATASPATATVKFYTDAAGMNWVSDPKHVDMPAKNETKEHSYYAKAVDGSSESELQEIKVTVYQKPEVTLTLSGGKTTVCEGSEITLKTNNENGYVPGTYTYSCGGPVPAVDSCKTTASTSTTYYVYVTASNTKPEGRCKDTASVDITVNPTIPAGAISIAAKPDKSPVCAGESLDLTASVSGTYTGTITWQWGEKVAAADRSKQTVSVSPSTTTTYTVQAVLNGCAGGEVSKKITVNPLPVLAVKQPAAVCEGTKVNITQSGGTGTYTYYTDAALKYQEMNPTAVAAGDYYVTLTDKGCTSEAKKVTATVNALPEPKILVDGAATAPEVCAGTDVTLSCDNTGYTAYSWTGGTAAGNTWERKATIAAGSANTFGLKVKDANGCEGIGSVTVTGKAAPTVTIEPIAAACAGDEVTLKATPTWATSAGTVAWTGNNVTNAGSLSTTATLNGGTNKYELALTDANGCETKESVSVTGNVLKAIGLTINPTTVTAGNSVNLGITAQWNGTPTTAGVNYIWKKTLPAPEKSLGTTKNITDTPDANSTYEVVVEKEGCKDSVSGNVTVETDPFELAGINGYRAVCAGEDLSANPMKLYVTASGGQKNYAYTWTVPNGMTVEAVNTDTLKITAIDYSVMLPGSSATVKVEVSDASTPQNTDSKTLEFEIRELPQIRINGKNAGDEIAACQNVTTNLTAAVTGVSGGVTYGWNTGAASATITAPTGTVGTASYVVTATYGGCTNRDSVKVQVRELPEVKLTATLSGTEVEQVCPGAEITLAAAVTGVASPDVEWGKGALGFTGTAPKATVNGRTEYEVKYTDATTTCEASASVTVDVYPKANLAIAVEPSAAVCAGSTVTLTASNGSTYQWAADGTDLTGETNSTLTVKPATATTYTVSGKDVNGCEAAPASETISITPAPELVLAKTALDACEGGTVDLAAAMDKGKSTPGITLKVKNGTGTVLDGTTVTSAGTYTLYLDGGSCLSNEETVTVNFHTSPNVTLAVDKREVCSGEEIVLTASSTDTPAPVFTCKGTANTTWTVTPSNTGTSNTSETYVVTAKDSYGCTSTDNISVTVKPLPKVEIADPGAVCASSEVKLTASGATSYTWTDGVNTETGSTYTVRPTMTNKTFTVTGTKNGCTGTDDITLNVMEAPVLADAKPLTECVGSELDLNTAFTTSYTLSFYDGTRAPASSKITVAAAAETYYAKATVGSCSTDFMPITVNPKALPDVSVTGDKEICAGETTTLTASGNGVSYTWSPAGQGGATTGTSIVAEPAATTTYTVTAEGGNGCEKKATWEVTVNPRPELKWDAGNESTIVAGETTRLNVQVKKSTTSPYRYTWTHNGTVDGSRIYANYDLTGVVNPEEVEVFATDDKGCVSEPIKTSVVVTPKGGELTVALKAAEGAADICQGGVQMLTVTPAGGMLPYKYVWYKDGVELSLADDVTTITVTDAGTYKVTVTDGGTQTKEATQVVNISAALTAPTVTVADVTIPAGNTTILLPTVTPAGNYSYQWSKVEDLLNNSQELLPNPETKILTATTSYELLVKDEQGCYAKATGTVHIDDAQGFKVIAAADPGTICIGNTARLSATLSGNVPADATYEWMPAGGLSATDIADPVFTSTVAETREFVVKVTGGGSVAVGKVTVVVEDKKAPTLVLTPAEDVSCVGEKIMVTPQGGNIAGNYEWTIDGRTPLTGGNTLDTLAAGNRKVKVTATAQNGCVVTPVEMDYRIHDLPTIDWAPATPTVVDKDSDLTVKAIADGGAAGSYTYTWTSPVDGTALGDRDSVRMNNAKTFKVSVKNNNTGCVSKEISKTVKVQAATPKVEIAVKEEKTALCQGGVALLEVIAVKGGNGKENVFTDYKYEWTESGTTTVLSEEKSCVVRAAGAYTVKVTEPKTGKSATKEITVELKTDAAPSVADATLTVPSGSQAHLFAYVTGGTPDYTYDWTPMTALTTSNTMINPTTSALSAAQTFTCYVTDAAGCTGSGKIQVNVTETTQPDLFTVTAKADIKEPCQGNTVQLSAVTSRTLKNPTYRWVPATDLSADNIQNPVFTAKTVGTTVYTVEVTEEDGYAVTAQVAVTVKPSEAPRLKLTDEGICAGENIHAENENAAVTVTHYHWIIDGVLDGGVTGQDYALPAGAGQTVKVYATADNGCASDTVSGVFDRKPTPAIAWNVLPTTPPTAGDDFSVSVTSDPGVTYVWSYVFTPQEGSAKPTEYGADMEVLDIVDAKVGTYAITVYTEKDGCRSEVLEHTVTVLDKGAGLAVTTNFVTKQVCVNGSVRAVATAVNGSGSYTYKWYAGTTVTGTPVAVGAEVMLTPAVNGQQYIVEVNDGSETAVSSPITLTFGPDLAPVVKGGTQHVAEGFATILLSDVTRGIATEYHWSPASALASGEESKPNPQTTPLTDDETYTYYVADAKGCVSEPAEVKVIVDKNTDALVIEAEAGQVNLCRGNTARLRVKAVQGTLSAGAAYEWTPAAYLTDANTANPVFTATVAGDYTFRVKVTDGGKVYVADVNVKVQGNDAPEIAWKPGECTTSYVPGGSVKMTVLVTKETTAPYTYHWLKPSVQSSAISDYSIATATASQYDFAVVVSDKNGCQTTDTLKAHLEIEGGSQQIEIETEDVKVCAVPEGVDGTVTLSVTQTGGPDEVDYAWVADGGALSVSDANTADATVDIAGAGPGTYTFTVTVTARNDAANTVSKKVYLTVSALPEVQIDETCLARHKDSVFVLNVAKTGNYDYLWQESKYDHVGKMWQTPSDKGTSTKYEGNMAGQDLSYILIATDKSELHCKAADTAFVYRIPDAPVIEIDTNRTRLEVKLSWSSSIGVNDGYTVWSRKWDPYCLTAADGGVYKEDGSTLGNTWAEPHMDTLEFYYVTADRNVCHQNYHSLSTDTVGYYLFDVQKDPGRTLNDNFMAVYFDFAAMGCPTSKEVFERLNIHTGNTLMYYWDYDGQKTYSSTHVGASGMSMKAFAIKQGSVLQIRPSVAAKFLQYGKLPQTNEFELKNTNTAANWSWCFALPTKEDKFEVSDLFKTDFKEIYFMNRWNFTTQKLVSTTNTITYTPVGTAEAKKPLTPLIFIKLQPRKTAASFIWK